MAAEETAIRRIGIIGGSYNPVHIAHLVIADRFTEQMKLDRAFLVPASRSPFKLDDTSADVVTNEERLSMLELAIGRQRKFAISPIEIQRGGTSYSFDTVEYFQEQFPQAEVFLLIGSDQAVAFTKWHRWEEILQKVQLCIARRPHTIPKEMERALSFQLTYDDKKPVWIDAPIIALSSSEIRTRIASGLSVHYLVPREVEQYIVSRNLYSTGGSVS